jgi:sporulation protein YlmC with PRC-barrel domain
MKTTTAIAALAAALLLAPAAGLAQSGKGDSFLTVQPAGQWLASLFIGQPVTNSAGETIGNVNDILFDKGGRVANVVIGVGGFLGIGEKNVAVPYSTLAITADANGKRVIKAPLSKERLQAAPEFKPTEKTVFMRAREQASEIGQKAVDKASELKEKADRKIQDMRK